MTPGEAHPEGTPETAAPSVMSGDATRKRPLGKTDSSVSSDGSDALMGPSRLRRLAREQRCACDQAQVVEEGGALPDVATEVLCDPTGNIVHKPRRTRSLQETLVAAIKAGEALVGNELKEGWSACKTKADRDAFLGNLPEEVKEHLKVTMAADKVDVEKHNGAVKVLKQLVAARPPLENESWMVGPHIIWKGPPIIGEQVPGPLLPLTQMPQPKPKQPTKAQQQAAHVDEVMAMVDKAELVNVARKHVQKLAQKMLNRTEPDEAKVIRIAQRLDAILRGVFIRAYRRALVAGSDDLLLFQQAELELATPAATSLANEEGCDHWTLYRALQEASRSSYVCNVLVLLDGELPVLSEEERAEVMVLSDFDTMLITHIAGAMVHGILKQLDRLKEKPARNSLNGAMVVIMESMRTPVGPLLSERSELDLVHALDEGAAYGPAHVLVRVTRETVALCAHIEVGAHSFFKSHVMNALSLVELEAHILKIGDIRRAWKSILDSAPLLERTDGAAHDEACFRWFVRQYLKSLGNEKRNAISDGFKKARREANAQRKAARKHKKQAADGVADGKENCSEQGGQQQSSSSSSSSLSGSSSSTSAEASSQACDPDDVVDESRMLTPRAPGTDERRPVGGQAPATDPPMMMTADVAKAVLARQRKGDERTALAPRKRAGGSDLRGKLEALYSN